MKKFDNLILEIAETGKHYQIRELHRKDNKAQAKYNNKYEVSKQVTTYFKHLLTLIDTNESPTVAQLKQSDNYRNELVKRLSTKQLDNIEYHLFDMIDNLNLWHKFSAHELGVLTDYIFTSDVAGLYANVSNKEAYAIRLRQTVAYQLHMTYNPTEYDTVFDVLGTIVKDNKYTDLRQVTMQDIYRQCKRLQRQRQKVAKEYADSLKPTSQQIANIQGKYAVEQYVYDNMLFENAETLAITRERIQALEDKARDKFEDDTLDINELLQYIVKCPNKPLQTDLAKALRSLHANQSQDIPEHIIQLIRRLYNGLDY